MNSIFNILLQASDVVIPFRIIFSYVRLRLVNCFLSLLLARCFLCLRFLRLSCFLYCNFIAKCFDLCCFIASGLYCSCRDCLLVLSFHFFLTFRIMTRFFASKLFTLWKFKSCLIYIELECKKEAADLSICCNFINDLTLRLGHWHYR